MLMTSAFFAALLARLTIQRTSLLPDSFFALSVSALPISGFS